MFELPKLKYPYNSLEPVIDAKTVEIHYTKHHQNYLNNLNSLITNLDNVKDKTIEDILGNVDKFPENIRQPLINSGGGYYNHNIYWETLTPKSPGIPDGVLLTDINRDFGSFDNFKDTFTKQAVSLFGSGWVWLTGTNGTLLIENTSNQDNPISKGRYPLLGIDLWEHAYYLKYQNLRTEYIKNWWSIVDWGSVAKRYASSRNIKN